MQQFFVKLGARYVIVTDMDGYCPWFLVLSTFVTLILASDEGIIDKKTWLAFLNEAGDH